MTTSQGTMEALSRSESLGLLSSQTICRVVFSSEGLPMAFPVNTIVKEADVFFCSAPGSKLDKAIAHSVMTIEADHWNQLSHTGWSVLVTGRSEMVTDNALSSAVRRELEAWAPGPHDQVVRVPSTYVSGRRLTRAIQGSRIP
jgi:nitroimidazol reductase NimA-like FMN-containing flavoprotein (pyridoxamine 5'-phosphate oxidase superfamily)